MRQKLMCPSEQANSIVCLCRKANLDFKCLGEQWSFYEYCQVHIFVLPFKKFQRLPRTQLNFSIYHLGIYHPLATNGFSNLTTTFFHDHSLLQEQCCMLLLVPEMSLLASTARPRAPFSGSGQCYPSLQPSELSCSYELPYALEPYAALTF